jgi:hypothetical protein
VKVINFCELCGKVYVVDEEGGISICFDCMYKPPPPKVHEKPTKDKKGSKDV